MDLEGEFELEHLLLKERTCKTCGKTKDLLDGFYKTRKDRGALPSAYSYECKQCTIKRIAKRRRQPKKWITDYPDW